MTPAGKRMINKGGTREMANTKRYYGIGTRPRVVPDGRIVVHNHVRPPGFPNTTAGEHGFRVWSDVPKPKGYAVVACDCGWAPHLPRHYRVNFDAPRS